MKEASINDTVSSMAIISKQNLPANEQEIKDYIVAATLQLLNQPVQKKEN